MIQSLELDDGNFGNRFRRLRHERLLVHRTKCTCPGVEHELIVVIIDENDLWRSECPRERRLA